MVAPEYNTMVKAILFDLDDTLYDTSNQVEKARKNAVAAMVASGLEKPESEVKEQLESIVAHKGSNYGRHYNDLLRHYSISDRPKIVAAGVVAYHDTKNAYLVPKRDAISTLLGLRDQGYLIGLVTDGVPVKQWEKIIRLGLKDFFHCVIVTEDGKMQKPSPEAFLAAAKTLGAKPSECMIVGDRPDRDIRAGNLAKMTTVHLVGGKYSRMEPGSKDEIADHTINSLREILDLVKTI